MVKYVKYPVSNFLILHSGMTQIRSNRNTTLFFSVQLQPQGIWPVRSKCGCLHFAFLYIIMQFGSLFRSYDNKYGPDLPNTMGVELHVHYYSNVHCNTFLSVAALCGVSTVELHHSGFSLLPLKGWLQMV
jgi:hypothetical protein